MLFVPLLLQLAVLDTTYSSAALKRLVADAAEQNRRIPAALQRYAVDVETEIAITLRQGQGVEATVSLEQLQSTALWSRAGEFEQHVVGDRMQSAGPQLTALSFMRRSILIPHLYGNRLSLLFGSDSGSTTPLRRRNAPAVVAVHPLSEERDRYYRFSGGDTILVMQTGARRIPVVRVQVEPRAGLPGETITFSGQLFLDVSRGHLVGLRGRLSAASRPGIPRVFDLAGLESALYLDVDNEEVERQVWLPAHQRFEGQIEFRIAADTRSVFRANSAFTNYHLQLDSSLAGPAEDSIRVPIHRLTLAPRDSLDRFRRWRSTLGTLTDGARAEDFDDVAPDAWRATGPPRILWRPLRLAELAHVNRIEGWYTGAGASLLARDRLPGLRAHLNAGWAWQERAMRGAGLMALTRGPNDVIVHGGRTLDITNDLRAPLDSGSTLGALFGADDYDYVGRDLVAIGWRREWGRQRRVVSHLDLAQVRDYQVERHITGSPIGLGAPFRPNRRVLPGDYFRSMLTLTVNPDVAVGLMDPGIGAQATLQRGDGDFTFQRAEIRLMARHHGERATIAGRLDAGVVRGPRIPPQQLIEVGNAQNLMGYGYKAFTGNEAVVARALVMRPLPLWRAPLRLAGRFVVPAPAPALSASLQAGWVGIRGEPARISVASLAVPGDSMTIATNCLAPRTTDVLTGPTCGWRTSVGFGIRFFGGVFGLDVARAIDRRQPWRVQLAFGQVL